MREKRSVEEIKRRMDSRSVSFFFHFRFSLSHIFGMISYDWTFTSRARKEEEAKDLLGLLLLLLLLPYRARGTTRNAREEKEK